MPGKVQSLQRAFRLLYLVAGRDEGCSVREMADGAGLKLITAYNLIRTLESEGFLRRSEPPLRFHLGYAVQELKQLNDGRGLLKEAVNELLKGQRDMPEASFSVIQWAEGDTYQRIGVEPGRIGRLVRRRECHIHPYAAPGALLFLAFATEAEAELFYRKHPFEKEGTGAWISRDHLERFLVRIRQFGWAQLDSPCDGICRIAAPVWSQGRIVAAFSADSCVRGAAETSRRKLARVCRTLADSLTDRLRCLQRPPAGAVD